MTATRLDLILEREIRVLNELRTAGRVLIKNPGFAIVAVLTLALGIGANTAIFSVVNAVLLRPLPYPDSDRIVRVWTATADEPRSNHSAGDFRKLRQEQQSLQAIAGYRSILFTVVPPGGESAQLPGSFVTSEFFDALGLNAELGRVFSGRVDPPGGERKVVISHAAWQQLFAQRRDALGSTLRVDGQPYTIVGVTPADTEWPRGASVWVLSDKEVPPSPLDMGQGPADQEVRYFEAIARLKPGVSLNDARQDLSRVASIIQQRPQGTASDERRDFAIGVLREEIVGDVRDVLFVLQAAVGLVLLIACANVSSLLIARATGRRRELAVRAALGASRGRLVRQLLTESLMLAVAGGAAGLLLGVWLIALLTRVMPDNLPRSEGISIDLTVAAVTLLTALATGVVFGILPALQASATNAHAALKISGDRGSGTIRTFARSTMIVGEVALTLVLLAGAGLLLNSLLRLQRVDSGMRPDHTTVASLILPQSRYPSRVNQIDIYRRLLEGLSRHGEVQAVGVGFPGPLRAGNAGGTVTVEGRPANDARAYFNLGSVSGGFFRAMGIPFLSGRTFTDADIEDAPPVAIASATLARKYWPNESAVGKRVRFDDDPKTPWTTIVGVVGDVHQLGLHLDPPPILYIPYQQFPLPFTNVTIRSAAPSSTVASLVRQELRAIDADLAPGGIDSLQQLIDGSIAQPRFRTQLLAAFALVALLLAAIGVYGLIGHSVAQRTREIGIRVALGAQPGEVIRQTMREGLVLTMIGIGLGLASALAAMRLLAAFLFGVQAWDPLTFAAVVLMLLMVATLAAYIPARRALRIDPIMALRAE